MKFGDSVAQPSVASDDCIDMSPYEVPCSPFRWGGCPNWLCASEAVPHEGSERFCAYASCEGGVVCPESGGLLLASIAERMEYSLLAASDPNAKLASKGPRKKGSAEGNGSPKGEVINSEW
jgi:hypothetical protein